MFDVGSIVEKDAQKLELMHPQTGAPVGASIELAGSGHPKRRKLEMEHARKLRVRVSRRGRIEFPDPVEDEEYEIDRLVVCTLSWEGVARDGHPIPCTPEEIRELYTSAAWIRRQAIAFLDDSANFLQSTGGD